jgi:hypothetical protein
MLGHDVMALTFIGPQLALDRQEAAKRLHATPTGLARVDEALSEGLIEGRVLLLTTNGPPSHAVAP